MVEIFGKQYYIDIDGITEKCRYGTKIKEDDEESETTEINIFKYEIIKMCLDRVLFDSEDMDEQMGPFSTSSSPGMVSFKIAFNTLIKYEILIEEYE
jgi:hypothetical protein